MNESGNNNITLIGMPASGKSTVGVILAKILGLSFVDTDLVIQQREGALLCDIISERGLEGFLKAEESAVLSISPSNTVIATGGSVVYSEAGMEYLKSLGKVVYLKVEKEDLFKRLHNIKQRGVVLSPGETLDEMYAARSVLYEKYADIVIDETNASVEETVEMIRELMK
ncbi:MAG: shikimate kinase [Eubacterium sp.]|nr:shikimate kinase [Eubacterium sp.]